jgi:hypothetical protein
MDCSMVSPEVILSAHQSNTSDYFQEAAQQQSKWLAPSQVKSNTNSTRKCKKQGTRDEIIEGESGRKYAQRKSSKQVHGIM